MSDDRQGLVLSPERNFVYKNLQGKPGREQSIIRILLYLQRSSNIFKNLQGIPDLSRYHFSPAFTMLLLKLFSLALLASQHVASAPTEEDFRLSIRDDTCGGDELSKRAPCNQDVQCGGTHHLRPFRRHSHHC